MARVQTSVEVFQYPAGPEPRFPCWDGLTIDPGAGDLTFAATGSEFHEVSPAESVEEMRRGFEHGREQGLLEGRQLERAAQSSLRAEGEHKRICEVADLLQSFAEERGRYFQAVEHEVVELALAIAARILRREAQMDPLLLTGAVRVALGQLASSTEVRLRVPATELALWTESMAHVPNLAPKPAVLAGTEMHLGECIIETELGSVNLGIRAQLGEIERGFFDRAASKVPEESVRSPIRTSVGSELENEL